MILRFLFFLLIAYLLYRFIFGFVIPVYRTTRKVKQGFREMQDRMNEAERQRTPPPQSTPQREQPGEYIDFEEVKD